MSLYAVFRPATVEEFHCGEPIPFAGVMRKRDPFQIEVCTRHGRLFKRVDGAKRLCARVGGFVKDLADGRIVYDARELN